MPNWAELFRYVLTRVGAFLKKAGTIIAGMAILLWLLLTFPYDPASHQEVLSKMELIQTSPASEAVIAEQLAPLQAELSSRRLENSYGGRLGKAVAPLFEPIGYDWKLTIGILASLAAREVFVATLGTVFALGEVEEETSSLSLTLLEAKGTNGKPAYTLATCLSLLLFFAFSLQCISTIGVARRETNSWKIPALMFGYMFFLAYASAFAAFHLTNAFLG
jgi:ferrous iron transport protein B